MGIWYEDNRLDFFEIVDKKIKKKSRGVAAICRKSDLLDSGDGYHSLRVKNYGKIYNLCTCERFHEQPAAAGAICTGVLVAADVVATAAHFAHRADVGNLFFIFGYEMADPLSPVIRLPNKKIYSGVRILQSKYDISGPNTTGSDWALVQLDRKVEGQEIVVLSKKPVFLGQNLYLLGHPCGLPLKYAPGKVVKNLEKSIFTIEASVFSGNGGSPVFNAASHEMVGMVIHSDPRDFRWVEGCWVSVIYPNKEIESHGPRCIKVSEFIKYIVDAKEKDEDHVVKIYPPENRILSQDDKFLKEFMDAIEKNLSAQDFNIDAICKQLNINRVSFFRKVKKITGETPNEFIQSYRLDRAAQLLRKKYGNVTEVAEAVGFSDPFSFSKYFKRKFGQPPKQYQLDYLKESESEPKVEQDGKDKEGTPQRHEIFKQVMEYYDFNSVLNEALKHISPAELIQKIQQMIEEAKRDNRKV